MALLNSIALIILVAFCMSQVIPIASLKAREVVLPRGVAHRLSPLSSSAISHYITLLKDGSLAQHATKFCKDSGITCNDIYNARLIKPNANLPWRPATNTPFIKPNTNIGWGSPSTTSSKLRNPPRTNGPNIGWGSRIPRTNGPNIGWGSRGTTSSKLPTRSTSDQEIRDLRNKHVYFREKELVVGGQILVSSLANVVPPRPFLPQAIASSLPFSTNLLPQLTQLLGISTKSYLYKSMALSLQNCEEQRMGEDKMCATSMEDMLQFAMSKVLQKASGTLKIVSSDGKSTSFPQSPTLQQVVLKVPEDKKSVACHDVMFPFAVYACHQIPHTKVYEASWTMFGKLVRAVAVCHMNTSGFDATHPAFAALYMKPGDGEVCHWINEDNLVMWEA